MFQQNLLQLFNNLILFYHKTTTISTHLQVLNKLKL
jgi:hypothetical protein